MTPDTDLDLLLLQQSARMSPPLRDAVLRVIAALRAKDAEIARLTQERDATYISPGYGKSIYGSSTNETVWRERAETAERALADARAALQEIINVLGPDYFSGELEGLLCEGQEALQVARRATKAGRVNDQPAL